MTYINRLNEAFNETEYDDLYRRICIEYASKLLNKELPVIFDKKHLSMLMGVEETTLNYYIASTDNFYTECSIAKKSGGYRHISMPSYNLKKIQRWILDNILYKVRINKSAKGFVKNMSIVDNAISHINKDIVVSIDLENFFPSIEFRKVFIMFYGLGYTKELSYAFSKLVTYKGKLPQGSPASPCIANIILRKLDSRLSGLARYIKCDYTRYADDITFSGSKNIYDYINTILDIIEDEGFIVNLSKLKIRYSNTRQEVTGIIVNEKLSVKREFKKKLRQHIHYCKKFGVYNHLKYIGQEDKFFYKDYLYGHAYFIKMIEPECGEKFINQLDSINWNS